MKFPNLQEIQLLQSESAMLTIPSTSAKMHSGLELVRFSMTNELITPINSWLYKTIEVPNRKFERILEIFVNVQ